MIRWFFIVFLVQTLCIKTHGQDYYISRKAAAVVPEQMLTVPLPEAGWVEVHHDGQGEVRKGTLLAEVNKTELALEQAELQLQQRQNRAAAEEVLLRLRRELEELEFLLAQPTGSRGFMEARFKARADERALQLLREKIALQEEAVRLSNEKLQYAFDKRRAARQVHMPFDGRVQFHIQASRGGEVPVAQPGPLLTAVDDSTLYIALTPGETDTVQVPGEQLQARLDMGGGRYLRANWHHSRVELRDNRETLVYYFALPQEAREQARKLLGTQAVAEIYYRAAEGEELKYISKADLAAEAGASPFETWQELVAALHPEEEIVFTGETHLCLRRRQKD